jgi:hypothetical protein
MSKNSEAIKKNWMWILAGGVIVFALINFTLPWVYHTGCCTYNGNRTCQSCTTVTTQPCPSWNGVCTDAISNQCCTSIDYCEGQIVTNPYECLHYYCSDSGQCCVPTPHNNVAWLEYQCGCMDIDNVNTLMSGR